MCGRTSYPSTPAHQCDSAHGSAQSMQMSFRFDMRRGYGDRLRCEVGTVRRWRPSTLAGPGLRGVSHQVAFFVSLVSGVVLIVLAPNGAVRVECAIYALSLSGLLGVSALLHRRDWSPDVRRHLRRLDHSMIFVLIAGTYTAIAGVALDGVMRTVVLVAVVGRRVGRGRVHGGVDRCAEVGGGDAVRRARMDRGRRRAAVARRPRCREVVARHPRWSVVYGRGDRLRVEATRPHSHVFGYHEVFHALVVAAAVVHYAVIMSLVLAES